MVVPVIYLIIDKWHDNKPNIAISFELIRSSLVCLMIRNLHKHAAELLSLKLDVAFLSQLGQVQQDAFNNMQNTNIYIPAGKYWVLNLGICTFDIIGKFKSTKMTLEYSFKKTGRKKIYTNKLYVDFKNYAHLMIYISELDEINSSLKKIDKTISKKNHTPTVETTRIASSWQEIEPVKEKEK